MCGIYGEASRVGEPADRARVARALELLRRRGPDDSGVFFGPGVALAHRRLSIIDLASGRQPIANEDGTVVVVFNGEIYNFPALRAALEARGHRFSTRTDTEVIVHLYEERGEETPQELWGDFAFALYDARRRRLFFARDRIGVKPLYLRRRGTSFHLASEIEPLLLAGPCDLDLAALDDFFTYGYVPGERTVWHGIEQLPPGMWGVFDERGFRSGRYWELPRDARPAAPEAFAEELRELLADAVRIRLMSDVPLGAFLSGGLDSSTVVGLMRRFGPVRTYTVGFPAGTPDETHDALVVARHFDCEPHVERLDRLDEEDLRAAVGAMNEPFADPSLLPTFLVARSAAAHVKVALAGDGADELFAGYRWLTRTVRQFRQPRWFRRGLGVAGRWCDRALGLSPRGRSLIARLARYARDGNGTLAGAFLRRRSIFSPELKERAYSADFLAYAERRGWPHMHRAAAAGPGRPGELLDFDTRYYLPGDILPKVDRTSMHHGLEVRVPFLDHRVVEHVVRLPAEQRYARGPKCLLKDAVATLLPRTVLSKPKQGFGIPIDHYLTGRFWEFLCDHVLDGGPVAAGFVDRVKAERLVREQREGLADWSMQLWCLLVAGLWWELQRERGRNAATNDLDYEKAGVEAARSVSIQ